MSGRIFNKIIYSYYLKGRSDVQLPCKIPELGWLKISYVVRGPWFRPLVSFFIDLVQILQGSKSGPSSMSAYRRRQH